MHIYTVELHLHSWFDIGHSAYHHDVLLACQLTAKPESLCLCTCCVCIWSLEFLLWRVLQKLTAGFPSVQLLEDNFDLLVHSPLARAAQTAEIVWGDRKGKIDVLPCLREIDLYSFQVGLPCCLFNPLSHILVLHSYAWCFRGTSCETTIAAIIQRHHCEASAIQAKHSRHSSSTVHTTNNTWMTFCVVVV